MLGTIPIFITGALDLAARASLPPSSQAAIHPSGRKDLLLRHCSFEMFATTTVHSGPGTDYQWNVVPALNGNPRAVSFGSPAFAGYYIAPVTELKPNVSVRLGLVQVRAMPLSAARRPSATTDRMSALIAVRTLTETLRRSHRSLPSMSQ